MNNNPSYVQAKIHGTQETFFSVNSIAGIPWRKEKNSGKRLLWLLQGWDNENEKMKMKQKPHEKIKSILDLF